MSFMQPQIVLGTWIEIDGEKGVDVIPADLIDAKVLGNGFEFDSDKVFDACRNYTDNNMAYSITIRENAYGARLSAPGYMDCTPWSVYDTEADARYALTEMYGEDDDNDN